MVVPGIADLSKDDAVPRNPTAGGPLTPVHMLFEGTAPRSCHLLTLRKGAALPQFLKPVS
jgi:hypothetical protein